MKNLLTLLVFLFSGPVHAATIATVNGQSLTDADLNQALSGFTEPQRYNLLKDSASKMQVIDTLIDQEILVQQAKKEGLDKSEEYQKALKNFQKTFLAQLQIQKKIAPKVSEASVKKYYNDNKQRFTTTEVHL